jgi:predicted ATP-grasp superfamily ATP-dependent carboligase
MEAFDALERDVVVKPLFGAEGRGIVRVSDPDLALRTFRTLERIQAVLYLQKFIPHEGFDVRVLVLDGRAVGAIRRRSADDFRTNVSRNGRPEAHDLTANETELALRAVEATGSRFAGVDLLYDRAGQVYVIEVNAVPGWRAFQRVTGIDVAALVIASLEETSRPTNHHAAGTHSTISLLPSSAPCLSVSLVESTTSCPSSSLGLRRAQPSGTPGFGSSASPDGIQPWNRDAELPTPAVPKLELGN